MVTGGNDDGGGAPMKKQRIDGDCISEVDFSGRKSIENTDKSPNPRSSSAPCVRFNDASTADVILCLRMDRRSPPFHCAGASSESSSIATADHPDTQIYLHSRVLRRSKYFAALLSDRWQHQNDENLPQTHRLNLLIPFDSIDHHLTVLKLLYSDDLLPSIDTVSTALDFLPIGLELLFEDCIKACIKFLEAVPWSEDEENNILNLIPLLGEEESKVLLARVSPLKNDSSEQMLHGLICSTFHNHPNMAPAKAFVGKLLRDFSSRETAKKVLDSAFDKSLRIVRQSLEEYTSPDLRGDHNETEAIQRLNLHTAMVNGKHLLWLVERMIELRVADMAVKAWSEQVSFTADLQRAFRDDAWRNFVPSLPSVVLRCTCRLANGVVTGNILAARQVRMKFVRYWLPVLIICKDNASSPMGPSHKLLYIELEELFMKIISTLPLSDGQELLQHSLSLLTRNADDCPHLVAAFTTWFRRANGTTLLNP